MLMKANNKAVKLLAVAGALAVLSGCSLIPKEEEALKPPLVVPVKENFELYEVKPGDITKKFTAVRRLLPAKRPACITSSRGSVWRASR